MTGQELYRLCRQLVDDPDPSFWTDQDVVDAMKLGYYEFQNWVGTIDPQIYEKPYDFTANGTAEFDLNGILFGATPSVGRAMKITRIYYRNGSSPDFGGWITPVSNIEQLYSSGTMSGSGWGWGSWRWTLQGRVLRFNVTLSGPFRLYYMPVPTIDWATFLASTTEMDDDTFIWQQLIPYFAVQAYAIKDWAMNPTLQMKFEQLKAECNTWLIKGRNGNANKWVRSSQSNGFGRGNGGDW